MSHTEVGLDLIGQYIVVIKIKKWAAISACRASAQLRFKAACSLYNSRLKTAKQFNSVLFIYTKLPVQPYLWVTLKKKEGSQGITGSKGID